jgi:hypothetical protein
MNYFLPEAKITRDQGQVFKRGGMLIVPMFHPAAALRATGVMNQFIDTFKKLPAIIAGKGIAGETEANLKKEELETKPIVPPQAKLF